jgi:hypothetical protein
LIAASKWGLDISLTCVQKILVDLIAESFSYDGIYKNSLDKEIRIIKSLLGISGSHAKLWLPPDSEIISNDPFKVQFNSPINEFLCIAGRRSGKSTLAAILLSWIARRISRDIQFLDSVPILPGTTISLLNVASEIRQAKIIQRYLAAYLSKLGLIRPEIEPSEKIPINIKSDHFSLLYETLTSSARSARGRTSACICLDEFAHFQKSNGPLADRSMWYALAPSVATFGKKSLKVITTSPNGRSGVVWDLFKMRGEREGMLTVQLPTWELNPNVPRSQLEAEFERDEHYARQEYGAEFLEPDGQFLRWEDIRECVKEIKNDKQAQMHIHVDIGLVHDATAIAMGYLLNEKPVICMVEKYRGSHENPLPVGFIENRIIELANNYDIAEVTFDQFQSSHIIERLNGKGIRASQINISQKTDSEIYGTLRDLIRNHDVILPDNEELIHELSTLTCVPVSYGFKVEAVYGETDDMADAVACCVWSLVRGRLKWRDEFRVIEERRDL